MIQKQWNDSSKADPDEVKHLCQEWGIGYVMWLQKGIEIEATNGKY